jgi:hypothetical protein
MVSNSFDFKKKGLKKTKNKKASDPSGGSLMAVIIIIIVIILLVNACKRHGNIPTEDFDKNHSEMFCNALANEMKYASSNHPLFFLNNEYVLCEESTGNPEPKHFDGYVDLIDFTSKPQNYMNGLFFNYKKYKFNYSVSFYGFPKDEKVAEVLPFYIRIPGKTSDDLGYDGFARLSTQNLYFTFNGTSSSKEIADIKLTRFDFEVMRASVLTEDKLFDIVLDITNRLERILNNYHIIRYDALNDVDVSRIEEPVIEEPEVPPVEEPPADENDGEENNTEGEGNESNPEGEEEEEEPAGEEGGTF